MKKIKAFVVLLIFYLLVVGIMSLPAAITLWLLNKVLSMGIPFIIWYIISFGVLIVIEIIEIYDEYKASA